MEIAAEIDFLEEVHFAYTRLSEMQQNLANDFIDRVAIFAIYDNRAAKRRPCPKRAHTHARVHTYTYAHVCMCVSSSIVGRNNFHWRIAIISQLRRVTRDDWRSTDAVFISRNYTALGIAFIEATIEYVSGHATKSCDASAALVIYFRSVAPFLLFLFSFSFFLVSLAKGLTTKRADVRTIAR